MTLNIQPKREEAIKSSPEFLKEFNKICEGLGVSDVSIPVDWDEEVHKALKEFSFTELQHLCHLLPSQYMELSNGEVRNLLILKLGATIVLACKPSVFRNGDYPVIVRQYSSLIDDCNAKFEEARKQAVETIYRREMLSGKI